MLSLFIPTRWAAAGLIGVAFACTFASAITGWMAPKLNWDLLAYAALVMSWLGTVDPHAAVYADATAFAQTHGLVATFQASSLRDGFQSVMARSRLRPTRRLCRIGRSLYCGPADLRTGNDAPGYTRQVLAPDAGAYGRNAA